MYRIVQVSPDEFARIPIAEKPHRRGIAKGTIAVEVLTKNGLFGGIEKGANPLLAVADLFFRLLKFANVGICAQPADNPAGRIFEGQNTRQKRAEAAVGAAQGTPDR